MPVCVHPIAVGFIVSVAGGWVTLPVLRRVLDWAMNVKPDAGRPGLCPAIVGMAERGFFTAAVAWSVPGTVVGMMVWISAKMAANWEARPDGHRVRTYRIRALVLDLVSMGFALAGGLIARPGA